MTEQHLSNITKQIDDFTQKTGDSPTHILVTQQQWEDLGCPKTYEHSVSCLLDYLVVYSVGDYHYPIFPMVVQLPQFLHEPIYVKDPCILKLGKYRITRES